MTRHIFRFAVTVALAAGLAGCSKQKETDQKLAELQKQLEATKQELAAKSAEVGNTAAEARHCRIRCGPDSADAQSARRQPRRVRPRPRLSTAESRRRPRLPSAGGPR